MFPAALPEDISAALRAHLERSSPQELWWVFQCCLSSLLTHNNKALSTTIPFLSLTPLQEARLSFGQAALNSNTSRCIPVQPQATLQEFWGRSLAEKVISVYWDSWDLPGFGLDRGKLSSQKKLVFRLMAEKIHKNYLVAIVIFEKFCYFLPV